MWQPAFWYFLTLFPSPTSTWICSFLCLCYPTLFSFDPLPAVFPPEEEAWHKFESSQGSAALALSDLTVGPLLTHSRLRQKPLLGLAAVLQLALSISCVCGFSYFGLFQFSDLLSCASLCLCPPRHHSGLVGGVVCLHLRVFCCSRGYLVSTWLMYCVGALSVLMWEFGGTEKPGCHSHQSRMTCGKFWNLVSHIHRLFESGGKTLCP